MTAHINKIIVTLATSALLAATAFYVDMTSRVAVIEDDLEEALAVIMHLHPPSPHAGMAAESVTLTGNRAEKAERRRKMLQQLQQQTAPAAQPGDDDDSSGDDDSAGDDDDSSTPKTPAPKIEETTS
jgi:hypothetical protein